MVSWSGARSWSKMSTCCWGTIPATLATHRVSCHGQLDREVGVDPPVEELEELQLHRHCHRPRAILDIIISGENFRISTTTMPEQGTCERYGYISSRPYFYPGIIRKDDVFKYLIRHFDVH